MTLLLAKESIEERILRAADRLAPEVRATFLQAAEALRARIPVGELADLLESGAVTTALERLANIRIDPDDLAPIRDALQEALVGSATPTAAEFGLRFDLINPAAVRYADQTAAALVQGVSNETMMAIRRIVLAGQHGEMNVRNQAQLIQQIVGLTSRDALAVGRFYEGLLDTVGERQARRQRDIMAKRLLRRRAENIARTETIRAANMGQQLVWNTAQDQGLLPPGTMKVWIATEDARTCGICNDLDGAVVDLGSEYSVDTVDGEPLLRPSTTMTPPAHPSCRCAMGLGYVVNP